MQIQPTACCALAQISNIGNSTSMSELKQKLKEMKSELEENYSPEMTGGQTAVFAVTTPYEKELAKNLESLGFKMVFEFPRRNGYEPGTLRMWTRLV